MRTKVTRPRAPDTSTTIAYVYIIRCAPTGKVYIGSSLYLKSRISAHRNSLSDGLHGNDYLQKAWNKHGASSFSVAVLEVCDVKVRREREQWWIDFFQSGDARFGFNLMPIVSSLPVSSALSKKLKKYWAERWADPLYAAMRKAQLREIANHRKMSDSKRRNWQDPAYRAAQIAAQRVSYTLEVRSRNSAAIKAKWRDPEYRAKQMKDRGARMTPAFRAKLSVAAKNRKPRKKSDS